MLTLRKNVVTLFVDRSSQQWVVLDPEGKFWIVPRVENPWDLQFFDLPSQRNL